MRKYLNTFLIVTCVILLTGCFGGGSEAKYKDGKYLAEGTKDSYGWSEFVEVTVKDGNVSELVFDSKNEEGKLKSEDENYNKIYKEALNITATEAFDQIEKQYMDSKNPSEVKKVAGATVSTDNFVTMMTKLEEKMVNGDTTPITLTLKSK